MRKSPTGISILQSHGVAFEVETDCAVLPENIHAEQPRFPKFGTTSVQFNRRKGAVSFELSNATASTCEIFALLSCEAHNPKVVSSNLTPATIQFVNSTGVAQQEQPLLFSIWAHLGAKFLPTASR
jgi:hypothetical protein